MSFEYTADYENENYDDYQDNVENKDNDILSLQIIKWKM